MFRGRCASVRLACLVLLAVLALIALGPAGAAAQLSLPLGTLPDPTLLPIATTSQLPLTTVYNALNVSSIAAGGYYLDPTTGVKIYKLTSASFPTPSPNWGHDYSEGGDEVSLPYDGETRAVLLRQNGTSGGPWWLVDFTPGVGVSNPRQLTGILSPWIDLTFTFSNNPATPYYAYVSNGSSIIRFDIRTMTQADGDGWPITDSNATWLHQSENDGLFTWMRGVNGPTVVGYEPSTRTLKTYTNSGVNEPRIDRAGRYIGLSMTTPLNGLVVWDWQTNTIPWSTSGDPGIPFAHNASLRDRWVVVDWNLSFPDQFATFAPPVPNSGTEVGGPAPSTTVHGSGNWIQHPASGDLNDQWAVFLHYGSLEPTGSSWLAPGGMIFMTPNGQRRLLGHPYNATTVYNYFSFAKVSSDGQYVMFTSDMDGSGRSDVFLAEVPVQSGSTDTTPPTVSIASPGAGATVSGTITVSANATDNVGVAGVQFRLDGANLGAEVTTAPYGISWNTTTATNGSHTLTAVARDAAGNTGTSSAVSVTVSNDTTAPVISGVAVSNLSSSGATLTWTTNEGSDSQVEYGPTIAYGSLTPLDTTKLTAHAQTLNGLAAGTLYHYRVKSRDAAGNLATSGDFTFTTLVPSDITPPSVSITAPAAGSTVTGTVTVAASATDNVGVVGVQFKLDGANLGAEVTTVPYGSSWNTTTATNGSHTLTAVARDAVGNSATSAGISVTVANAIVPPGVVGYWKLDEGGGTIAADSSGYGNTGTLMNGPVWTPGKLNQALSFDGVDAYVDVPHAPVLNSYPLTVATWIKTNSTGLNNGIVNKYLPGSFNGFQVFMNAGNLCAWYFKDASNHTWDGTNCTLMTPGYNDNQWHHVALVVDAAGGRLYVDGMQAASQGWTGTPGTASTTQPLSIGRYPGTMSPFLPGLLDDVRIYNYALSASEVLSLSSASPLNSVAGVVWTDLANVTATGNSLQKTGGCDGCPDAGATSQQQILSGDGYLEFTASETGALRYAGLSTGNTGTSAEEIRFAVRLQSGIAEVRESGVYRADTPFVSGDVFRVAVESGVVKYSKNGTEFYQSTLAPTYPLLVDTSLASVNATITNAVISGALSTASIDTTPPTVAMTAPLAGATVAGSVTLSANATDDVGVAAVQFKLDGTNLGAEVTVPPYALSWVTTTAPNGSHTLTAVARDAAGNSATSAPVPVTVANDVSPPIISSVTSSGVSSSGASIAWTTNEASDSQVEYGPTTSYGSTTPLDTNLVTVHSQALTGLARNTWYHYRVKSRDPTGNLAISGDFVFKTTRR